MINCIIFNAIIPFYNGNPQNNAHYELNSLQYTTNGPVKNKVVAIWELDDSLSPPPPFLVCQWVHIRFLSLAKIKFSRF